MKRLSKLIAVMLAVLMTASLIAVPVFADDAQDDPYAALKEGTGYVAIGDSFTRGYGAGTNWQDQIYRNENYGDYECRNVDGSYPNIVAEKFGLYAPSDIRDTDAKYWPLSHDAVSTAYINDFLGLDDGFRDDEFTYQDGSMIRRYQTDLAYFGDPLSLTLDGTAAYGATGEIMSAREMIKNASLISIGLGQTDVIYKTQIFGFNTLDLSDTSTIPAGIKDILSRYYRYFNYWKGAYPLLLDFIKENNPDAKVLLVGTLNPIKDATISDDVDIEIGHLITFMMDTINAFTRECALKYGYTYIDITDVETPSSATTMSIGHILSLEGVEYGLIAHPTAKGYEQIAEKVIAAVEKDLQKDQATGIKAFFAKIADWFRNFFAKIRDFFSSLGK